MYCQDDRGEDGTGSTYPYPYPRPGPPPRAKKPFETGRPRRPLLIGGQQLGTMQAIGITVAVGLGAGALGWWFRASSLAARWAHAVHDTSLCTNAELRPVIWPLGTGLSASVVVGVLLPAHHGRFTAGTFAPWAVASVVVWACGLSLLALVDRERLVLPSRLVHTCALVTVSLLLTGCATAGEWRYLWQGALYAVIAGAVFALWALLRPGPLVSAMCAWRLWSPLEPACPRRRVASSRWHVLLF